MDQYRTLTGIPSITGYDVQYREHSEADWIDHDFASVSTTTMTTIPDLASNTTYQVQVRAKNDEGPKANGPRVVVLRKKARLTIAFSSATYTVGEGDTATTHSRGHPNCRSFDILVTITMTGTGATLYGLTSGMLDHRAWAEL